MERDRVAGAERAERARGRAPYRAPRAPAVAISRICTQGGSQIAELVAHLRHTGFAERPDLVFGVYRLPDRIDPALNPHSERLGSVEWDVVHGPFHLPPTTDAVSAVFFGARQQWVSRRVGEPSVLDEDVAAVYCARARIGPESCIGMARFPMFRVPAWGDHHDTLGTIEGVWVLHRPTPGAREALTGMAAGAPCTVPLQPVSAVHTAVLEWSQIERTLRPRASLPTRVPSPIPHLPGSPQELLEAYLEVVGVVSADCYSAQVTVDRSTRLAGPVEPTRAPLHETADGRRRPRLHGAQQVVIVYRDRPDYAEGRARWSAYQAEVLHTRFDAGDDGRPPLVDTGPPEAMKPAALTPAAATDRVLQLGEGKAPPPFRYCLPITPLPSNGAPSQGTRLSSR